MQEHLVAAQLIDEAWSHPGGGKNKDRENGFPEEHIVPSDETAPFGRIFVDGDHLLLSNQRRSTSHLLICLNILFKFVINHRWYIARRIFRG
jgi:hypothetical protein